MRLSIFCAATSAMFCISSIAMAETKWPKYSTIGVAICPNKNKVNESDCPKEKGSITIVGSLNDNIGRTVYNVQHANGQGFISEYQYEYDLVSEDPKVTADKERQRAAAASEARKKKIAATEDKRKKLAEEDAAKLAAMPQQELEKNCILTAAQKLPRIPGIEIIKSEALPVSPESKPEPGIFQRIVVIDIKAAGQEAKYSFVCATGPGKPYFVVPIGR